MIYYKDVKRTGTLIPKSILAYNKTSFSTVWLVPIVVAKRLLRKTILR